MLDIWFSSTFWKVHWFSLEFIFVESLFELDWFERFLFVSRVLASKYILLLPEVRWCNKSPPTRRRMFWVHGCVHMHVFPRIVSIVDCFRHRCVKRKNVKYSKRGCCSPKSEEITCSWWQGRDRRRCARHGEQWEQELQPVAVLCPLRNRLSFLLLAIADSSYRHVSDSAFYDMKMMTIFCQM